MAAASSTFHHQAPGSSTAASGAAATGGKRPPQVGLNFKAQKLGFYRYVVSQLYGDGLMDEAKSVATRLNLSLPVEPSNEENDNGNAQGGANVSTDLTVGGAIEKDFLYDVYADSIRRQEKGFEANTWKTIKCRPYPPLSAHEEHLDLRISYKDRLQAQLEAEGRDQPFRGREVDEMDLDDDDDAPRGEVYEEDMITEEAKRVTRPTPVVRLRFTTQHKKEVRCVAFSPDGRLCASGSTDTSIKVLETAKMRMHAVAGGDATLLRAGERDDGLRPVVRTYYDHVGTVTSVSFHPRQPILFSGSYDKTLKVYDLTKPNQNKRAQHNVVDVRFGRSIVGKIRFLPQVYPINKVQVHPCGDFVYVGTLHRVIRLYDTRTLQCFSAYYGGGSGIGGGGGQHHNGSVGLGGIFAVLDIACASDGSVFASAGSDGCDDNKVRFFDIVKGTKNIYEMEEEGITGISQSQAAAGMDMDETGAAVVPPEGGAARGFVEHIGT
ncbi:hypothetical protein Pmar_PMAR018202 [Perkinsus marinus ATCC 50983]|uniref:Cleavage stimulation factor 50 kDa subunit n=1 Tax=Perkinsus marinus (strain ATCC 50983 / TXsc) TaxID=423536 RepID=C5KZ51_PERM5|nr:hypothetical protein Pmar_PMAR018202 [Perkinsus marinus ATCC 50983]EER10201.1 hypothetical protein Pmar_PMAR018202 [Perkinsus marinus ATCC 50983]|eukprot:XP_002778406.1 hypothetical protein Pmar_PMAR018202 [Perkinsus marinus ATCC 50983]